MSTDFESLHDEAMSLSAQAFLAHMKGQDEHAKELKKEAFAKEREVALSVISSYELEPTRAVLFRSAASLAIDCQEFREAEKLIAFGLSGNPPEEIADELRELLDQVYFSRHLTLNQIELTNNEFQLSMSGDSVGSGIAPLRDVSARVQGVDTLVHRTEQRRKGIPFSKSSRKGLNASDRAETETFLSLPRASSYAITFRIGQQLSLDGIGSPEQIIDEIMTGIELLNNFRLEELRSFIPDDDYLQNFIGLVRSIAPDGERIKMVGFTSSRNGSERSTVLSRRDFAISDIHQVDGSESIASSSGQLSKGSQVEIRGVLKIADSNRKSQGLITIITNENEKKKVYVPLSLMGDVVKPLFESEVVVRGIVGGRGIPILESIDPA